MLAAHAHCCCDFCAAGKRAEVGVRYSSPQVTAGAVLQPATNRLSHVWLCGRHEGLTGGLIIRNLRHSDSRKDAQIEQM